MDVKDLVEVVEVTVDEEVEVVDTEVDEEVEVTAEVTEVEAAVDTKVETEVITVEGMEVDTKVVETVLVEKALQLHQQEEATTLEMTDLHDQTLTKVEAIKVEMEEATKEVVLTHEVVVEVTKVEDAQTLVEVDTKEVVVLTHEVVVEVTKVVIETEDPHHEVMEVEMVEVSPVETSAFSETNYTIQKSHGIHSVRFF